MSLVEFVQEILELDLTHTQMVSLELYEDVRFGTPSIYFPPNQPISREPWVTTTQLLKGDNVDGRD